MVLATLDLLRASGLSGAGLNAVIAASGAPKGSLYHYFPEGKKQLVAAALDQYAKRVSEGLRTAMAAPIPLARRVRMLFDRTADNLETERFEKSCAVASVTLDLEGDDDALRPLCEAIFSAWHRAIADGLGDLPAKRRAAVATLILGSLEGAMVLARAHASPQPLRDTGHALSALLDTHET